MISLKLKSGTAVEVKDGRVEVSGNSAVLYERYMKGNTTFTRLVLAYSLQPGEIVRHIAEGEYIVEF